MTFPENFIEVFPDWYNCIFCNTNDTVNENEYENEYEYENENVNENEYENVNENAYENERANENENAAAAEREASLPTHARWQGIFLSFNRDFQANAFFA